MSSNEPFTMRMAAKEIGTGRNKLFEFLRAEHILNENNLPYKCFINAGYFTTIEREKNINGNTVQVPVTLVTPSGIDFIQNLIIKEYSSIINCKEFSNAI